MPEAQKPLELILARNLISSLSTPAFLVDAEGTLVFFNEAAGCAARPALRGGRALGPSEWGQAFGPFDAAGEPIPWDELPLTIALRRGRPSHSRMHIHSAAAPSTTSRSARCPIIGTEGIRGAIAIFWPVGAEDGPAVKVKVWGARGSVPRPGPRPPATAGNTSCVHVTLDDGSAARPRRRHRHPQPRAGAAEDARAHPHPAHAPAPGPHPGPDVLRAAVPTPTPTSSSGARRRRRRRSRTASRATSRRRCRRSRCASCPATSSFRDAPGQRVADRLGDASAPTRSPTAGPRSATASPRATPRSATSPTTSRRSGAVADARGRVDLRLRARPRRRPAPARLPVHRRRVPRPHRLGALALSDALAFAHRCGRSAGALPPRPDARRRHARRVRDRRGRAVAAAGGDPAQIAIARERRPLEFARPRAAGRVRRRARARRDRAERAPDVTSASTAAV